jgi:hypothetical protein
VFSILLRVYSYLYHAVLSLLLLGMGLIAKLSNSSTFTLEMLPWKGQELINYVLWGGAFGLLSVLLAITGIFRFLIPIWAAIVVWFMVQGFILRAYNFDSADHFYWVLFLIAGAIGAFLSALTVFKKKEVRYR